MIRIFGHYVPITAMIIPLAEAVVFFSILALCDTVYYESFSHFLTQGYKVIGLMTVTALLCNTVTGFYDRTMVLDFRASAYRYAIVLPIVAVLCIAGLFVASSLRGLSLDSFQYRILIVIGATELVAIMFRLSMARVTRIDGFRRRVIVLGISDQTERIIQFAQSREDVRFNIIGCVSLTEGGHLQNNIRGIPIHASTLVGERHALGRFCSDNYIDEIVFAEVERRRSTLGTTGLPVWDLLECRLAGVKVSQYASFWEREAQEIDLEHLKPGWLLFSDGFRYSVRGNLVKRSIDIVLSSLLLLITLPVTLVTAILVKLTSPGPVFYRQERVGRLGQPFNLFKFRSMTTDAERAGPQWAAVKDNRVTPIGRFIRRTRIDEIPQVLNVLKGDMSFIGPRPERPVFVDQLSKEIPYYGERHSIRPGITGWAQINYPYGASVEDAKRKLAFDLYYIKNGSTFLDMVIALHTAKVVLFPQGVR